ncbi:MAG: S41 family peptidase [Pseudobdellovibrio sp.]
MKSWGIIIVSAMGFLVGMILAGVGGLFAKTNPNVLAKGENNIEYYWNQTGVGSKELFELVSNSNCQTSEKYFLACVNSILQVAPKYHFNLSEKSGQMVAYKASEPVSDSDGKTEKENLANFVSMYQKQNNTLIDFQSIWSQILKIDKSEQSRSLAIGIGINGFLSVYKDPHTYILPTKYYEENNSKVERSNLFIGLSFEKKNGQIFVRKVFKGSDAEAAGLKEQDRLVSLDGIEATKLTMSDISSALRLPDANSYLVEVARNNQAIKLQIKRSYKVLKHVIAEKKSGLRDYSVITLSKFNSGVCSEVATKIKELSENSVSGVILDLRDNPGGQLDEASCIAGLFIGMNKKIYSVKYFDPLKPDEVVLTTGSLLYTGPLVVLVNSSSASASELLAGALQDYSRAVLVGERTFGKGTFQESEVWGKNKNISLFRTQGFYLLPAGESTQLKGVTPDFIQSEQHVQMREEISYYNPITSHQYLDSLPSTKSKNFSSELEKCLPGSDFDQADAVLSKGLEVLSCHRISSFMATLFSSEDFNQ